ncbi:MAG TPA: hypothetical protein VKT28_20705 [Puia sp.]|nr:hypothetical protein [Puia sp.]
MKKYVGLFGFLMIASVFQALAFNEKEVNEKVIQAFKKTFPSAEKVNWQEFSDRYMVHFQESNIQVVVDYDKDGNYLRSKRYYQEDNLPINILYKIRKKYADKKIFGVTEVSTDTSIDYYVKLEDEKNWMTIKSDASGSLEVFEKYQKQ